MNTALRPKSNIGIKKVNGWHARRRCPDSHGIGCSQVQPAQPGCHAHAAISSAPVILLYYFIRCRKVQNSGGILELEYLTKPINTPDLANALERLGCKESSAADDDRESSCQTILIVDDDPGVLDMHAQIVRAKFPQDQVLLASGGREALQLLQTGHPNLVLLDLMMPEVDGFGVLEAMQKMETARQVPVIVISAKTLTEEEMTRLNRS